MKKKVIIGIVAVVVIGGVAYYGYKQGWFGAKAQTTPTK